MLKKTRWRKAGSKEKREKLGRTLEWWLKRQHSSLYLSNSNEQVEMGLTWIDYDTIEKPIEEITVGTGEAKDIEFTVETLKCSGDIKKQGNGLTKKVKKKSCKKIEVGMAQR